MFFLLFSFGGLLQILFKCNSQREISGESSNVCAFEILEALLFRLEELTLDFACSDIGDGTMFIGLQRYQNKYNSPYKLCFGPKSFLVVSDPVQARHILRDANTNYDKGVLAEILEPIMVSFPLPCFFPPSLFSSPF
jgi:hypothetical protein